LFAIHGTRKKAAPETNYKPNPPAPAQPGNNGAPAAKVTSSEHGPFVSNE